MLRIYNFRRNENFLQYQVLPFISILQTLKPTVMISGRMLNTRRNLSSFDDIEDILGETANNNRLHLYSPNKNKQLLKTWLNASQVLLRRNSVIYESRAYAHDFFISAAIQSLATFGGRKLNDYWNTLPANETYDIIGELSENWMTFGGLGVLMCVSQYVVYSVFSSKNDTSSPNHQNYKLKVECKRGPMDNENLAVRYEEFIQKVFHKLIIANKEIYPKLLCNWNITADNYDLSTAKIGQHGEITIYKGVYKDFDADILAFIVSHELGHFLSNHFDYNIRRAIFMINFGLANFIVASFAPTLSMAVMINFTMFCIDQYGFSLPKQRNFEYEADAVAYKLTKRAGFDTTKIFPKVEKNFLFEVMRSHPNDVNRVLRLKTLEETDQRKGENKYHAKKSSL